MRLRPLLRLLLAGLVSGLWAGLIHSLPGTGVIHHAPTIAHADGPGDWPTFHHDPAHTGYNPDETQLKPLLRLKWS